MSPNSQMKVLKAHNRVNPYLTIIDAIRLLEMKGRAIKDKKMIKANSEVQCLMSQECNEIMKGV